MHSDYSEVTDVDANNRTHYVIYKLDGGWNLDEMRIVQLLKKKFVLSVGFVSTERKVRQYNSCRVQLQAITHPGHLATSSMHQ